MELKSLSASISLPNGILCSSGGFSFSCLTKRSPSLAKKSTTSLACDTRQRHHSDPPASESKRPAGAVGIERIASAKPDFGQQPAHLAASFRHKPNTNSIRFDQCF